VGLRDLTVPPLGARARVGFAATTTMPATLRVYPRLLGTVLGRDQSCKSSNHASLFVQLWISPHFGHRNGSPTQIGGNRSQVERSTAIPVGTSSAPLGHLMTMRAMHSFQIQMEAEGAAGMPGG
jgi:hypothetical protein